MQKPKLEIEQTLEEQIMVDVAILKEQISTLTKHIDSLTEEIKELKKIQVDRLENHEKRITLSESQINRLNWIVNLISAALVTGLIGAVLSVIIKN